MDQIILALTALLLSLFSLTLHTRRRRELSLPLPKGLPAALKNRHAVYLIMSVSLALSAAAALTEAAGRSLGAPAGLLGLLSAASGVLQAVFLLALALYAVHTLRRSEDAGGKGAAVVPLAAVTAIGAVLQALFSLPVALFF